MPPLHFTHLASKLPVKCLRSFRQEAEWPDVPQRGAADPRGRVEWVGVEQDRQSIGIARLELAAPEFCFIGDLIIRKAWRGRGVGRWLITQIEAYCASLGIRRLLLQAAPGTEAFYATLGFLPDHHVAGMLCKHVAPLQAKKFLPPGRHKNQALAR